jgi:hypothetical protein
VRIIRTAISVLPRIIASKVRASITSRRDGRRTTAVAERGRWLISAISPKNSPAGSTASTRSTSPMVRRISTSPDWITYMKSPGSPSRNSTAPGS